MTEAAAVSENRLYDGLGVEVSEIRDPLWVVPVAWTNVVTYTGEVLMRAPSPAEAKVAVEEAVLDSEDFEIHCVEEVDSDSAGLIEVDPNRTIELFT